MALSINKSVNCSICVGKLPNCAQVSPTDVSEFVSQLGQFNIFLPQRHSPGKIVSVIIR
jgi:hypothetical protein